MKSSAKLWLLIFSLGFAVVVALLIVTLFTPPPYGALTRIGRVSEEAFGWHSKPPPLRAEDMRNTPLDQADVLVIGDSFSMYYAWQAPMVAAGYRVASTHWDKVAPLCEDFGAWLQKAGFKGRLVILQSIERLVPERLSEARNCKTMRQPYPKAPIPPIPPFEPPAPGTLNWNVPLLTGLITYQNTRTIEKSTAPYALSHDHFGDFIFASPVPQGCSYFSNRLCDKSLFLLADRENPELTPADAETMQALATRVQPAQLMWMVVPNKASVYLDLQRAQAFAQRATELKIGPDLFQTARAQRGKIIDLYWPNDTHWSLQGQKYFGDQMLGVVRDAIGPASGSPRL